MNQSSAKSAMYIMFGIASIIFAVGTFVNNPLKADQPNFTQNTGKYMMHQNSFVHNGNYYYQILVWDTETGKSKLYDIDNGNLVKAQFGLPSSPLY